MKIITLLSAPAHASTLSRSCEIPDALCTDPISVGELLAIESKTEPLNLLSKSLCACVDHLHVLLSVEPQAQKLQRVMHRRWKNVPDRTHCPPC